MNNEFDPNYIYHALIEAGHAWAEAERIADKMDGLQKSVLAKYKLQSQAKTQDGKETEALAHPEYVEFVETMVAAKEEARKRKAEYEARKAWVDSMRTLMASKRIEANIL